MELQRTEKGEEIIFTTADERLVVGAAYLEEIARAAKNEDVVPDDIRRQRQKFARIGKTPDAVKMSYPVNEAILQDLGRVVQQFVDGTSAALREIAHNFGPTYLNGHLETRDSLGLDAQEFMESFNNEMTIRATSVPDYPEE